MVHDAASKWGKEVNGDTWVIIIRHKKSFLVCPGECPNHSSLWWWCFNGWNFMKHTGRKKNTNEQLYHHFSSRWCPTRKYPPLCTQHSTELFVQVLTCIRACRLQGPEEFHMTMGCMCCVWRRQSCSICTHLSTGLIMPPHTIYSPHGLEPPPQGWSHWRCWKFFWFLLAFCLHEGCV